MLAGLFGLALYFWAPLVVGWLGTGEEPATAAAKPVRVHEEPVPVGSATGAAENESPSQQRPSWDTLQQWRQESPWASPAELAQVRDPFRLVSGEAETVNESETTEESPITTPEQMIAGLDLQLTGTIVGPRRSIAMLDGRAYREGDVVRVDHLGTSWELEIRRIEPDRVVLGWQSIEHELTVPKRQPVGRIELVDHSR